MGLLKQRPPWITEGRANEIYPLLAEICYVAEAGHAKTVAIRALFDEAIQWAYENGELDYSLRELGYPLPGAALNGDTDGTA